MGANISTDYKLRVTLDKLQYSPGDFINGTFSFDFGNDEMKKKKFKNKKSCCGNKFSSN